MPSPSSVGVRANPDAILEVQNLTTALRFGSRIVPVVDGVSLEVDRGESVGIIGESGSGKSLTASSILRLVPEPGQIIGGKIMLNGRNLIELSDEDLGSVRGKEIAIIFQDPTTYMNPVLTVGDQLVEVIRRHTGRNKEDAEKRAVDLLRHVGIPEPELRMKYYQHQLSGGQTQRVMTAIALAGEPRLIIADEPTTALDIVTQEQILALLRDVSSKDDVSLLVITHDVSVVAKLCQRIYVMYAGQIVESGTAEEILRQSKHPYTRGLTESVPTLNNWDKPIPYIEGSPPSPDANLPGCRFAGRCRYAMKKCTDAVPGITRLSDSHQVRCYLHGDSRQLTDRES